MKKNIIIIIIIIIMLSGCSMGNISSTNYYILEYYEHLEKDDLKLDNPFPQTAFVLDTNVPQTYSRKQIAIRHFGPRITYSTNHIWGVDLSEIISSLISKKMNRYGVFQQTKREFLDVKADYEILSNLNSIELIQYEGFNQARLDMDFYLKKSGKDIFLVHHSVNLEGELVDAKVETFVLKINIMLLNEIDEFVRKVEEFLAKGKYSKDKIEEITKPAASKYPDRKISASGMGSLLLPALTKSDNRPYYHVINKNGELAGSAKMGNGVVLPVGTYSVYYGSGTENQQMVKENIEIISRYKTVIDPDWGSLTVDIMDENRNFVNMRYEIFDTETGTSFGTGFPAEEELGEQQKVWILKPGLYKITINDEPFNTYKDFTTVYIEKNKTEELTIIVGIDENDNPTNMIGAGISVENERLKETEKLKFTSAIHGNINISSNNEITRDDHQTTITLNSQLDNRFIFDKYPFYFISKNLIEMGTTKNSDTDFRISSDDFDLKNTFIYYFLRNLGLYSRLDAESHFFARYDYDVENYLQIDTQNDTVQSTEDVRTKPPLFPLILKEGLGINLRLFNSSRVNLFLRSGFGMRQEFNNNVFNASEPWTDENSVIYNTFIEQESEYKIGTEVSVVGNFNLPFNLSYNSNADFLFPFNKDETITMEWENSFNLRLFKYISLDYKLNFKNKEVTDGDDYILLDQSLFLRITYILR